MNERPGQAGALALIVVICLAAAADALPTGAPTRGEPAEVLVLGVYHMSNPGRDVFNTEADDVLSSHRQAEIARVVDVLERFSPTRIAVEQAVGSQRIAERYDAYRAGERELSDNEAEQLGFRLAARLGHEAVHPVDVEGEFPFPRLVKYAKATEQEGRLQALLDETGAAIAEQSEYLATHTVLEVLLRINSPEHVRADVGSYFQLAELGEQWDWAGADMVAAWFQRNMRIYTHVAALADSSDERVLVIYGAGHLGWLQYAFGNNPRFRLRHLAEFVD